VGTATIIFISLIDCLFGVIGVVSYGQYDNDVTPLVDAAIQKPVGDFIAQEMTNRLHNSKNFKELVQKRKAQKLTSLDMRLN